MNTFDLAEERSFGGLTHTDDPTGDVPDPEELAHYKNEIHATLLDEVDPSVLHVMDNDELASQVSDVAVKFVESRGLALTARVMEQITREVMYELRGLGPIQPFLDDDTITEVMVNGPRNVFVERNGRIFRTDVCFQNDEHVKRVIDPHR